MGENKDASLAWECFHRKEYQKALDILNQLDKKEGTANDFKIQHNIALARYYMNGCTEPHKFLKEITDIKDKIEEKATEQDSASSNTSDSDSSPIIGEYESYLLSYNQALVYFQLKHYSTALSLLESLYLNVEPVDEYLGTKICFLLIDICLLLKQPERIPRVITSLEKILSNLQRRKEQESRKEGDNSSREGNEISSSLFPTAPPISEVDLKYQLHLYKAKFDLSNKSLKAAKRELANALETSSSRINKATLTFLSAQAEYLRKNYTKAIRILNNWQKDFPESIAPLYWNNVGVVHAQLHKVHAAGLYLRRALPLADSPAATPLEHHRQRGRAVSWNVGLQLLKAQRPEAAFTAFQAALREFPGQPLLWLRLAECCVAVHAAQSTTSLVKRVAGSGTTRRLVLPESHRNGLLADKNHDDFELTIPEPSLSLEYAAQCVRNVLFLLRNLPPRPTESETTTLPKRSADDSDAAHVTSSGTAWSGRHEDLERLREAALLQGAFVALAVADPLTALRYCRQLSDRHRWLRGVYAAEGWVQLGQPATAALQLEPLLPLLSAEATPTTPTPTAPTSDTGPHAACVAAAVVQSLQGDWSAAQQWLRQALSLGSSPAAQLLSVYLALRRGQPESALHALKTQSFSA